ncbi:proton-conducting transporter transmembrane domain-containing protein [Hyphococcus luteus]|uniref:Cation:proton antiporter n=1 Tax=Hyphococcus luteus TaxID=2058213 RepID=A0A2S7K026_9PROT|nr:proton-conducting transporter membrane subunit [Marinicaulis flavus]PQA85821.1 cation:proton antiporter [Marinicaulis flavus]
MISAELAIPLALFLPLAGFIAIWLIGEKSPNLREAATLVTGAILFSLAVIVFAAVAGGARPDFELIEVIDGLPIAFQAEPLGAMFAVIASGLWIVNSVYSIGYMRGHGEEHQTRFYMCFAVAISAAMGVAFAANLFTLFIFYEVLTLSTFPLVTHYGDAKARNGGRIYLGVLMATSIGLLLPAIVWTYAITGTTDFVAGGIMAAHSEAVAPIAGVLMGLYAFGIGKAALMPVHPWLPNAMVAPTPVSAFLHAVAVVKAGVFSILKVAVYIFGVDFLHETGAGTPYMWIAGGSILLASAIAMNKDNLKARLAYSTVSQLSYVTLGAMLATQMGVMGGAMQIAAHALGKMTLFMCAGAIYVAHHKSLVSELRGLGRVMPFTFGAFFLGAMSIVGLPPMAGSWPKFFLMLGAADAGQLAIIAVLMISSILNVIYLLSIPVQAFYMKPAEDGAKPQGAENASIQWGNLKEAPILCLAPPMVTAAGAFLLFFFADPLYEFLTPLIGGQ